MAYCQSSLLLRWLHLPDAYCLCVLCMLMFGTAQWVTVLNCVFYDCISSRLQIWEISLYLGRESNKAKVHCVQIIQKQKKKKEVNWFWWESEAKLIVFRFFKSKICYCELILMKMCCYLQQIGLFFQLLQLKNCNCMEFHSDVIRNFAAICIREVRPYSAPE